MLKRQVDQAHRPLIDLRWVHGFPIHWFTHFGSRPMVDQLIRYEQLSSDLETAGKTLDLPLTKLTAEMCWYYWRVSPRKELQLKPQRKRRSDR